MLRKKTTFEEKLPLILAFVLPILIMLGIFAGKQIWPFGENCFLRTDLYHQYVAFFEDFADRVRQGKSLTYAFDIGLGSNYSALFAYYLCGPLHLFAFLVPTEYIIEFITYLIVLKIALCGLTMAWYLSKRFETRHIGIAFCGVCYALSGYLAAYSWNIMWLDVLWLTPIVIYGLEKLIKEDKPFLYCISLALAILCNYYISIMLCLFLALYFINRILALPAAGLGKQFRRFGNFVLFSLLAGGIAAILVIPCAYALAGTASANSTFPKTISNYFSILDMLARHLVVVDVEIGLDHWPNLYSGVLVFLLIPLYYMNPRVSYREKISNTLLLGFMLLSFNTNVLNFIWHGLHYPNSLPCRQSYLYTFVVMAMCFEGFRDIRERSKGQLVGTVWGSVILILILEVITDSAEIPYYACYASIAFIGLYALIIYLFKINRMDSMTAVALGLCVLIIEMGLNTAVTSVSYVNRTTFMQYNDCYDELVAVAEDEGDPLTRVERNNIRTKNDGAYFGYNSASIFSSTTNKLISDFYRAAGLEGNTNAYCITGASPFMYSFLHVGYRLSDSTLPASPLYELVATAQNRSGYTCYLYRNNYTLPLGYLVPDDTAELWQPVSSSPIKTQNSYVNIAAGVGNILVVENSTVAGSKLTATVQTPGHYMVHVTSSSVKKVTASIGDGKSRTWDNVNRGYLVDFGYCSDGDQLTLTAADDVSMNATLYRLDEQTFIEAWEKLSAHPYEIESITDTRSKTEIRGKVNAEEASLLTLSIPYDNGWSATVDGEEVKIGKLGNAFLAVAVGPGEHEVVFSFTPEGLGLGLKVCLISLGIFLLLFFLFRLLPLRKKNGGNPAENAPVPAVPKEEVSSRTDAVIQAAEEEKKARPAEESGKERIAKMHAYDEAERARIREELSKTRPIPTVEERHEDEKLLDLDAEKAQETAEEAVPAEPEIPGFLFEGERVKEAAGEVLPEEKPAEEPAPEAPIVEELVIGYEDIPELPIDEEAAGVPELPGEASAEELPEEAAPQAPEAEIPVHALSIEEMEAMLAKAEATLKAYEDSLHD